MQAELIARLNAQYAKVGVGIGRKADMLVAEMPTGEVETLWSYDSFKRALIAEPKVRIATESKWRYIPLADWWLEHPEARKYKRLQFLPPTRDGEQSLAVGEYNTWHGLALKARPGDWKFNRAHIRDVICAGNDEHEQWLHNWIAGLLQAPGEHGWVAPVLKGGQGTGKGFFAHNQLGGMFRDRNYCHLTVPEHLTSDFNSHLEDKVLVFADEAVWGQAKVANRLKGLITETDIMINRKHVPQENQKSCLHIIIASNHERPIPVERDDRRLFVLQVSEAFKQQNDHFEMLRWELDHAGGRAAMLDYFSRLEVNWSMLKTPPESAAKREMKAASLDPETEWWQEVLDTADTTSWERMTRIPRSVLAAEYSLWFDKWKRASAFEGKRSSAALGHWLRKHFRQGGMDGAPVDAGKVQLADKAQRDNTWRFPPLLECRQVFEKATGTDPKWSDADETPDLAA